MRAVLWREAVWVIPEIFFTWLCVTMCSITLKIMVQSDISDKGILALPNSFVRIYIVERVSMWQSRLQTQWSPSPDILDLELHSGSVGELLGLKVKRCRLRPRHDFWESPSLGTKTCACPVFLWHRVVFVILSCLICLGCIVQKKKACLISTTRCPERCMVHVFLSNNCMHFNAGSCTFMRSNFLRIQATTKEKHEISSISNGQ